MTLCFICGISLSYPYLSKFWVFTDEQMKVLFRESVTQQCLGSRWPPNIMSDSPKGQTGFRFQQYLVDVKPHCTHSFQICIAQSPDWWRQQLQPANYDRILCLWFHKTEFCIDLKRGHVEVTGPQPVQGCRSVFAWCAGPTGALSRVGQPEWEDGIWSYWSKLLIICEQVQSCCRAERGKDVCVC